MSTLAREQSVSRNDSDEFDDDSEEESESGSSDDDDDDDELEDDEESEDEEESEVEIETSQTEKEVVISSDDNGERESCPICLNRFIGQDLGVPESCDHTFCLECITEWSRNINTCPIDRTEFNYVHLKESSNGKVLKKIKVKMKPKEPEDALEDEVTLCEVCRRGDREDRLLLCDGCDLAYHCECLDPPLFYIPIEEWFCPSCAGVFQNRSHGASCSTSSRRVIPRTRASEAVRSRVENLRTGTRPVSHRSPSTSQTRKAAPKRRRKRRAYRVGVRKVVRLARTKQNSMDAGKGKVGARATKVIVTYRRRKRRRRKKRTSTRKSAKSVRSTGASSKNRIAKQLRLCEAQNGSSMPDVKKSSGSGQRGSAKKMSTHSLFGDKNELISFDDDDDISTPSTSAQATSRNNQFNFVQPSSSSFNILDTIMADQTLLHMNSKNVMIRTDGSLVPKKEVNKPSCSSSHRHVSKPSSSSVSSKSSVVKSSVTNKNQNSVFAKPPSRRNSGEESGGSNSAFLNKCDKSTSINNQKKSDKDGSSKAKKSSKSTDSKDPSTYDYSVPFTFSGTYVSIKDKNSSKSSHSTNRKNSSNNKSVDNRQASCSTSESSSEEDKIRKLRLCFFDRKFPQDSPASKSVASNGKVATKFRNGDLNSTKTSTQNITGNGSVVVKTEITSQEEDDAAESQSLLDSMSPDLNLGIKEEPVSDGENEIPPTQRDCDSPLFRVSQTLFRPIGQPIIKTEPCDSPVKIKKEPDSDMDTTIANTETSASDENMQSVNCVNALPSICEQSPPRDQSVVTNIYIKREPCDNDSSINTAPSNMEQNFNLNRISIKKEPLSADEMDITMQNEIDDLPPTQFVIPRSQRSALNSSPKNASVNEQHHFDFEKISIKKEPVSDDETFKSPKKNPIQKDVNKFPHKSSSYVSNTKRNNEGCSDFRKVVVKQEPLSDNELNSSFNSSLPPTQLVVAKNITTDFRNSIQSDDEDLPPTQVSFSKPSSSCNSYPRNTSKDDEEDLFSIPVSFSKSSSSCNSNPRNNVKDDEEDLPSTQVTFSKPSSCCNFNSRNNTKDDEDDLPPTQVSFSKPSSSCNFNSRNNAKDDEDLFSIPASFSKPSSSCNSNPRNNVKDDEEDLPPTQVLYSKTSSSCNFNSRNKAKDDKDLFSIPVSFSKSSAYFNNNSRNSANDEEEDLPPTQASFSRPSSSYKSDPRKIAKDDEEDLPPTQVSFSRPSSSYMSDPRKIANDEEEDLPPTQVSFYRPSSSYKSDPRKIAKDDDEDLPSTQLSFPKPISAFNFNPRNTATNDSKYLSLPKQSYAHKTPLIEDINCLQNEVDDLPPTQLSELPMASFERNMSSSFTSFGKSPFNRNEKIPFISPEIPEPTAIPKSHIDKGRTNCPSTQDLDDLPCTQVNETSACFDEFEELIFSSSNERTPQKPLKRTRGASDQSPTKLPSNVTTPKRKPSLYLDTSDDELNESVETLPSTQLAEKQNTNRKTNIDAEFSKSNLSSRTEDLPPTQCANDLPSTQYVDELPPTQFPSDLSIQFADDLPPTQYADALSIQFADDLPPTQYADALSPTKLGVTTELPATQYASRPPPTHLSNDLAPTQCYDRNINEKQIFKMPHSKSGRKSTKLDLSLTHGLDDELPPTQCISDAINTTAAANLTNFSEEVSQESLGVEDLPPTQIATDISKKRTSQEHFEKMDSIQDPLDLLSAEALENGEIGKDLIEKLRSHSSKSAKAVPPKIVAVHRNLPQVITAVPAKRTLIRKPHVNCKTFSFEESVSKDSLDGIQGPNDDLTSSGTNISNFNAENDESSSDSFPETQVNSWNVNQCLNPDKGVLLDAKSKSSSNSKDMLPLNQQIKNTSQSNPSKSSDKQGNNISDQLSKKIALKVVTDTGNSSSVTKKVKIISINSYKPEKEKNGKKDSTKFTYKHPLDDGFERRPKESPLKKKDSKSRKPSLDSIKNSKEKNVSSKTEISNLKNYQNDDSHSKSKDKSLPKVSNKMSDLIADDHSNKPQNSDSTSACISSQSKNNDSTKIKNAKLQKPSSIELNPCLENLGSNCSKPEKDSMHSSNKIAKKSEDFRSKDSTYEDSVKPKNNKEVCNSYKDKDNTSRKKSVHDSEDITPKDKLNFVHEGSISRTKENVSEIGVAVDSLEHTEEEHLEKKNAKNSFRTTSKEKTQSFNQEGSTDHLKSEHKRSRNISSDEHDNSKNKKISSEKAEDHQRRRSISVSRDLSAKEKNLGETIKSKEEKSSSKTNFKIHQNNVDTQLNKIINVMLKNNSLKKSKNEALKKDLQKNTGHEDKHSKNSFSKNSVQRSKNDSHEKIRSSKEYTHEHIMNRIIKQEGSEKISKTETTSRTSDRTLPKSHVDSKHYSNDDSKQHKRERSRNDYEDDDKRSKRQRHESRHEKFSRDERKYDSRKHSSDSKGDKDSKHNSRRDAAKDTQSSKRNYSMEREFSSKSESSKVYDSDRNSSSKENKHERRDRESSRKRESHDDKHVEKKKRDISKNDKDYKKSNGKKEFQNELSKRQEKSSLPSKSSVSKSNCNNTQNQKSDTNISNNNFNYLQTHIKKEPIDHIEWETPNSESSESIDTFIRNIKLENVSPDMYIKQEITEADSIFISPVYELDPEVQKSSEVSLDGLNFENLATHGISESDVLNHIKRENIKSTSEVKDSKRKGSLTHNDSDRKKQCLNSIETPSSEFDAYKYKGSSNPHERHRVNKYYKNKIRVKNGLDFLQQVATDIVNRKRHESGSTNGSLEFEMPKKASSLNHNDKGASKSEELKERIATEVKHILKPFFNSGVIDKDDYKDIMRRAVPKIFKNCKSCIQSEKIRKLVLNYVNLLRYT